MISEPLFRECDRVHCAVKIVDFMAGDTLNISAVEHVTPLWGTSMSAYIVNAGLRIAAPDITESKRLLTYLKWHEDWI